MTVSDAVSNSHTPSFYFNASAYATAEAIMKVLGKNGYLDQFMMRKAVKAQTKKNSEH